MEKKTEAPVHNGLPELLSIDNMASGAVYEMFNEALKRLAANVADPNTEPTQKRKILLSIEITPYKDRSGAEYNAKVETKLAGLKPATANMYFAHKDGEFLAFGRNTQQSEIEFDMSGPTIDPPAKTRTN
jgi:hypothetical protein